MESMEASADAHRVKVAPYFSVSEERSDVFTILPLGHG
jgi:hypothetical protein